MLKRDETMHWIKKWRKRRKHALPEAHPVLATLRLYLRDKETDFIGGLKKYSPGRDGLEMGKTEVIAAMAIAQADAHEESRAASEQPPAGTCSYLQLLQRAPGTAAFVGAPTVFLSHAWTYKFRNVVAALRSYVEALPAGSPPPFFWFDCLSIDEHATQTLTQEWWSTTFQDAIRAGAPPIAGTRRCASVVGLPVVRTLA